MNSRLLAGMIAVMTLSGISTSVSERSNLKNNSARDTRIIVEVNKSIENLSQEEIYASQDNVLKSISNQVTSNFKLLNRYSVLNNAFVVEVNKENVEAIRALNGVASVTLDEIHAKETIEDGSYYSAHFTRPEAVEGEDTGAVVENISAKTMHKPTDSNDGEGTVIAVLDNEFYLRGAHEADQTTADDGTAWSHAVYKDLDANIAKRFTFDSVGALLKDSKNKALTHAQRKDGALPGEEGSLYFNSKVPFYFDYGGESTSYGKVGPTDFDVSSNLTYHGSHVASIASANADTYKGIAPKAQLACMKVFTTYIADDTGEAMGFGTSTGAYDSAILSAVEDAIALGVDGINMSLGSDLDDFDSESLTMRTLSKLATNSGIMSAISAGNAGKSSYSFTGGYGNWTTEMVETGILGSYANSTDNTIVASSQPTEIYYEQALKLLDKNGNVVKNVAYEDQIVNREGLAADYDENAQRWMTDIVKGLDGELDLSKEIEWVFVPGFGTSQDYTDLDVKDKVAVVNRGSTSFANKYSVAVSKGAIALVIINNDPTATDFNFRCSFGDDFQSKIPCCLALYRDRPTFEENKSGKFVFIKKTVSVNDNANTISTYSSDGARFDYSLKPDITTPGENIRGAVPPQKKAHRDESPYSTYEYLSGTSMAAPNYAGAQSLILSKKAKDVYSKANPSSKEISDLVEFRKTVDLRIMSTAEPISDATNCPEDESQGKNFTSPRMQGAGLVNLEKAYNTDVYLDGLDEEGNRINKAKIQLKNNADIAKGDIKLSFQAINESNVNKNYEAEITIMRPAITENNKVVSAEYTKKGEIDAIENIPGLTYLQDNFVDGHKVIETATNSSAGYNKNDVIKLTKQITYYTEVQQGIESVENYDKSKGVTLETGYYYNAAETGCDWRVLPSYKYQSVQDYVIKKVTQNVTLKAGSNKVSLDTISLTQQEKDEILSLYPYGCAIEGFVELKQSGEAKLNIPFLGFYSGADKDAKNTLTNAPVVEPFHFEKDSSVIYPSDLVKDVTTQLVGKDSADFGSTWTVGYADSTMDVDKDSVLTNDGAFDSFKGFHKVGINPVDGKSFDDTINNIYVGNPEKTNTMIIQQFVLRSVKDNYFEIKNEKGEIVYKSVLEDMLFGDTALYKSHVDSSYLSAGYVCHRAYAMIPLYDINTHKAFASGNYTITFNYQLAFDSSWVNKSYNFFIDATSPEISSISEYTKNGEKRVRIEVKDMKLCDAVIGNERTTFEYDDAKGVYYIDNTASYFESAMNALTSYSNGQKRLFLSFTDAAFGKSTAIVHFFDNSFSNYVIAEGSELTTNMDFVKNGNEVKFYEIGWDGVETLYTPTGYIKITTSFGESLVKKLNSSGCGGSVVATTALVTTVSLVGATLISLKKRKENELEGE